MPIQKLYAYVEESGQDTKGRIFVVTVIISGENHMQLATLCETYERARPPQVARYQLSATP